jgi:glycosyltransferase involved in cell wall biosynthesis
MTGISVVNITKNSEETIDKVVNDAFQLGEEVIVVDTGSTDNTIEIAKTAGARVVVYDGEFDFSSPRNLGAEHATYNWILVWDTDETIKPFYTQRIRDIVDNPEADVYLFLQLTTRNGKKFLSLLPRLYNKNNLRFYGLVHEWIYPFKSPYIADVLIDHNPREDEKAIEKSNFERVTLATRELKDLLVAPYPNDPDSIARTISRLRHIYDLVPIDYSSFIFKYALSLYEKALQNEQKTTEMLCDIVKFLIKTKNYKQALFELYKTFNHSVLSPYYLAVFSEAHFYSRDFEIANSFIDGAIERNDCGFYHTFKTAIQKFRGDSEGANQEARIAYERLPELREITLENIKLRF